MVVHESQTLASPGSPKTWILYGDLWLDTVTVRDGLRQKSWAVGEYLAREEMFSRLRWSRSRSVAGGLLGLDIC